MKKRNAIVWTVVFVLILMVGYSLSLIRRGFSAKDQPSAFEVAVARVFRNLSIPSDAKNRQNPIAASPENVTEGREHFADHCATCHANNGSGKTEIGENLYPKPPDLRLPATQNMSDGDIYYIIQNGVRLTGMPAWGGSHSADDTWKLVLFIRHLPQLTPAEEKEMERFNPVSEDDRSENQGQGGTPSDQGSSGEPAHHHHH